MLRAKFFGYPQLSINEQASSPSLPGRGLALFTYLMTDNKPHPRTSLTDLLWSDVSEQQARENLRSLLYTLRQSLGDYLIVTRQTVAFNRQSPYWLDVEVFNHYFSASQQLAEPGLLTEIIALSQRDFLDGFYVQNAPVFETWLEAQRQHLRQQAIQGWQQLADHYLAQGQYAEGLTVTQRLLTLAPWHEEAHRQQMSLLALSGRRSAALRQYEVCCQVLRDELDVPPSAATNALYEQIKAQANAYTAGEAPVRADTSITVTQPSATLHAPGNALQAHHYIDWGTMSTPSQFLGRRAELTTLHQWVVAERCQVVSILGMGGQGKTTLAAHFVQTLTTAIAPATPPFEGVIWRSLLHAPPLTDILQDWLSQLSDQQIVTLPRTLDEQFALLAEYLRRRRFLLVLDNAESILAAAIDTNQANYAAYGQLWELFVQRDHQCCLLLTGREGPRELHSQKEQPGVFRQLVLEGLAPDDSDQLLKRYGLQGTSTAFTTLQQRYSGNPLALTLVAEAIDELFEGNVHAFLQEETLFFGDIGAVLDQQFARLSALERELLTWLALEQEPISSQQLWNNLVAPPSKRDYLTALHTLLQRSLIQQQGTLFGVQNVILEYARNRLVEEIYQELQDNKLAPTLIGHGPADGVNGTNESSLSSRHPVVLSSLNRYALSKAQAKDHVRAGQKRLLLAPLLQRLLQYWGRDGLEKLLQRVLTALRTARLAGAPLTAGYVAGNLLHLLLQFNETVQGYDFSQLTLRQVSLRNAQLHHVDLTGAALQDCTFTDVFAGVLALAFHPAGQLLAVGTFDGDIRLWRLGDNQFHAVLAGHPYMVTALAISPDGRWLASGSLEPKVHLWDLETHTLRHTWQETSRFVRGLAFSPDGQCLAVPGEEGDVKFYNVASGALERTLSSSSQRVWSVAFSPDGKCLAGGSGEGVLYLWDLNRLAGATTTGPRQTLRGHAGAVDTVIFSMDGQTLYSGGRDHLIYGWDLSAFAVGRLCPDQPWRTLRGHSHYVRSLALCPTGRCLASGSADGTVRLWDAQSGQLFDTLVGHELWVWMVAFQPRPSAARGAGEPQLLVSVGNDQRIVAWEIDCAAGACHGHLRQVLQGYADAIRGMAFMPAGQLLASAGFDKQVCLWDVKTGALHTVLGGRPSWIMSLAISPTGQTIACGDYERKISLWSLPVAMPPGHPHTCQPQQPTAILEGHNFPVLDVAFSPDGQTLASCSQEHSVYLWDVREPGNSSAGTRRQLLQTLTGHTDWVWSIAFSPDGQTLASASSDGTICLWDVGDLVNNRILNAQLQQTLIGHKNVVRNLAFAPDGERLVSSSIDCTIRIWDRSSGQCQVLTDHRAGVVALAVSPCVVEGRLTLASYDEDHHLRIWDLDRGEPMHVWQEAGGEIHKLTYSPDGKTLAGANQQGYIQLWNVQTGAAIQTLQIIKPYTGTDITGVTGITTAQKTALCALGAVVKA